MRHLADCVHPGVRPAGHRQRRRVAVPAEDRRERRLELALHGTQPRLSRPAVEIRALVGDVEPEPGRRQVVHTVILGKGSMGGSPVHPVSTRG